MPAPLPSNEAERLSVLHCLELLDTPQDERFDMVAQLAAYALRTPMAAFSLVDQDRQWFKAEVGIGVCETPRDQAFCAYAILADQPLIVNDTLKDKRFSDNPLVTGAPHMRAYLGAPIIVRDNIRIGTICVIDIKPRNFSPADVSAMVMISHLVKSRMELMITAKQAQVDAERLKDANLLAARASVVLESMSEGLVLQQRGGAIMQANPAACHVLGLSLDQLLGRESVDPRWRSITEDGVDFPGDHHPPMITLGNGLPLNNQVFGLHTPDNELRWLSVNTVPLFEDNQPTPSHVISTFSDITAIKVNEQELRELGQVAQAANIAKNEFLANMSHEIRTPLNGVLGVAAALSRTDLNDRQRKMVQIIAGSGQSLAGLLNDILDLSKMEAGELSLECVEVNPHDLLENVVALFEQTALAKGLTLNVENLIGPKIQIMGDPERIKQIISNLVGNAVKFTSVGSVDIEATLEPTADGSSKLLVKVSDTGPGFSNDVKKRLFGRFVQADTSTSRSFGGSGLGLSICKTLSQMMNGEVDCISTPKIGSTFWFKARFAVAMPQQTVAEQDNAKFTLPHNCAVLAAEDNEVNRVVLRLLLEDYVGTLDFALNGQEAVDATKIKTYDLVLMDTQMPIMDGIEAIRQIRAREVKTGQKRVPIITLSANAMADQVDEAKSVGADDYVSKPIDFAQLMRAIGRQLLPADIELSDPDYDQTPAAIIAKR